VNNNTCTGQLSRSPLTPTRRSVRLLARQLHDEELTREAMLTDGAKSPARRTSVRSPARQEVTLVTARRSPRLMAKHDNLLLEPTLATKTNVRTVNSTSQLSPCLTAKWYSFCQSLSVFVLEPVCLCVFTQQPTNY